MRNRPLNILLLAVIAFTTASCGIISSIVIRYGMQMDYNPAGFLSQKVEMERRVPGITRWIDSMYLAGSMHDTVIVRDGYKLHANYAAAADASRKTAVIVHGYGACSINMMHIARMFRDSLGYNVLLPDLRRHGLSEGAAAQMGWLDRLDVLDWSRLAHSIFSDTLQVYHGISMGAASIMNASGEETPDYVRGFIADCGFSSLRDVVIKLADERALPGKAIMDNLEPMVLKRFGWSVSDDVPSRQVAKCAKPMLFIHGNADQLVPEYMSHINFDSKTNGYREIWIADGSNHAFSYPDHPAEYTALVRKFLKEHVE